MINEGEFKKIVDMDTTILRMAFVQMEERNHKLEESLRKVELERNELLRKLTSVQLPIVRNDFPPVPKIPQNPLPLQKPVQSVQKPPVLPLPPKLPVSKAMGEF